MLKCTVYSALQLFSSLLAYNLKEKKATEESIFRKIKLQGKVLDKDAKFMIIKFCALHNIITETNRP